MLETLVQIDKAVFVFMNITLANPVTDFVMPLITNDWGLRIMYGVAMILLLWKGDARLRWLAIFSVLVLVLTDQAAAGYLKPVIERPRPCQAIESLNLLVGCGSGASMPSAHSANAFGQAMLFSYQCRRFGWYLYAYAVLIALSRVFVGVHYPGDILVGAALGTIIGLAFTLAFKPFRDRLKGEQKQEDAGQLKGR